MAIFHVYIDSSTKRTNKNNKYGESAVAWAVWNKDGLNEKPIKASIHYFRNNGPNVVFYEGIIRALEQCMSLVWSDDKLIIYGDCNPVIEQLNNKRRVEKMEKYYKQVRALEGKYRGKVEFQYIDRETSFYKKIDRLAKHGRENIPKFLQ